MIDITPEESRLMFNRHRIGVKYELSLIPRRCFISNRILWFKKAYVETAMWTGPGDPVFEDRWYDKDTYLIEKLLGHV